jgi:hypothetical protein
MLVDTKAVVSTIGTCIRYAPLNGRFLIFEAQKIPKKLCAISEMKELDNMKDLHKEASNFAYL